MLTSLDVNARAWLAEHLGKMRSTKERFLWCEANIANIILQPGEYEWLGDVPKPGFLRAKEEAVSRRVVDIPPYVLQGLADILFSDPLHAQHVADRLTAFMVEKLQLWELH